MLSEYSERMPGGLPRTVAALLYALSGSYLTGISPPLQEGISGMIAKVAHGRG